MPRFRTSDSSETVADIDLRAAALLPVPMARRLRAIPARVDGRRLTLAMADPWDEALRAGLSAVFAREALQRTQTGNYVQGPGGWVRK